MLTLVASVTAFCLIVISCLCQYAILGRTARPIKDRSLDGRLRVLIGLAAVFAAHLLSAALYAIVYFVMHVYMPGASLAGEFDADAMDFVYFSIMSYTTLGVGDIYPTGVLRLVSGLQAINGFVMLGWSTSFIYWTVRRSWETD